MSSSDSQPPLTRRQARERERASGSGSQPDAPSATVSAVPASEPSTAVGGSSAAGSASATDVEARRRPGSHAAPAVAPARSAPSPEPVVLPTPDDSLPASAVEIVPGTGMTRRQLRALRAAQDGPDARPVPLRPPTPQSSDRTVADVIEDVAAIEDRTTTEAAPDAAAFEQATAADGSPDVIEPFEQAVAHSEEPRRRRSTWAPPAALSGDAVEHDEPAEDDVSRAATPVPLSDDTDGTAHDEPVLDEPVAVPGVPLPDDVPSAQEESVFPLDLNADTDEVPAVRREDQDSRAQAPGDVPAPSDAGAQAPGDGPAATDAAAPGARVDADASADAHAPVNTDASGDAGAPASAGAPAKAGAPADAGAPSLVTPPAAAFVAPAGHWSRQAAVEDDHVRDRETGETRWTDTQANALVMPTSALGNVTGALNATGEVILTGSIDLPKALAATGAHTPIDGADVDRLLDQHDAEAPIADATPVRASRAVSSHTSTRAVVLAAAKPKQSRAPMILAVSAASVGVVGVAAIVVAIVGLHLL